MDPRCDHYHRPGGHLLDADQLEGIRLLTNAEMDSHAAFACLLVGQPTLRMDAITVGGTG